MVGPCGPESLLSIVGALRYKGRGLTGQGCMTPTRHDHRVMPAPRHLLLWGVLALLLTAPLIAMQFTDEVRWTPYDFAAGALLLGGLGLSVELVLRWFRRPRQRLLAIGAALSVVTLIWLDGAVGIF